jgi:hypothetical protein
MLTGAPPFEGADYDVQVAHLREEPAPPRAKRPAAAAAAPPRARDGGAKVPSCQVDFPK